MNREAVQSRSLLVAEAELLRAGHGGSACTGRLRQSRAMLPLRWQ
jgi:hypothetical protein